MGGSNIGSKNGKPMKTCSRCGARFNEDYGEHLCGMKAGDFNPVIPDNFAPKCGCGVCRGEAEAEREDAGTCPADGGADRHKKASAAAAAAYQDKWSHPVDSDFVKVSQPKGEP